MWKPSETVIARKNRSSYCGQINGKFTGSELAEVRRLCHHGKVCRKTDRAVRGFGRELSRTEQTLQGRFDLTVNREKTRTLSLYASGVGLDFLGYTFRYDRDLKGYRKTYLNLFPSKKSLQRERDKLREMTGPEQCFKPIIVLIAQIDRHLKGWSNYFGKGYPRRAFGQINHFVQERLTRHLNRRSQRAYRKPKGISWYAHLQQLGYTPLQQTSTNANA